MIDLIDRHAAIDAMMKLQTEDIEAYGASIPEGFDGDRAVAVLKALPSATDTNVGGNLIDRQAALDAIKKLEKPAPTAQHLSAIFDCEDTIKALPSVQPTGTNTVQVDDCISRQAAIEAMRKAKDKSELHRMLVQLPSVTPKQRGWIPWDKNTRNSMKYTLQTLYRLAYNIHGVMDAIDDDNVKRLIALLEGGQDGKN